MRIIMRHRNIVSQPYRSSFSDFQAKGLKKERERERYLKSTAADRNSITIFYINAIK